jgi:stearoyl-CoA desaturase (delta-9 desaturase)
MSILASQARRIAEGTAAKPHDHDFIPLNERVAVFVGVFLPPLGLLVAIIYYWNRGVSPLDIALMLSMYTFTLLGITIGYHRLFTHRSFETSPAIRFLLAAFGSMAWQGPVIQWCAIHRRHHQTSDREGDPHSPHHHPYGRGIPAALRALWRAHAGWLFEPEPADVARSVHDLLSDPVIRLADRLFWLFIALGFLIPATIGGLVTQSWTGFLTGLLWGGLIRMCLTHHVTGAINSICHIWGSKTYASNDESRNNLLFGLLAFGEGWHNNHHAFPTSARHGLAWYQFDLSWIIIKFMSFIGLARNLRLPTASALTAKTQTTSSLKVAA